jgi:hemerythrin family non-heme iron protein
MGFDIPEPFAWDTTFTVVYTNIDDEHKGLFKGIADLATNPTCTTTLDTLVKLVKAHFATEEKMMLDKNFPEYTTHKTAHDDFVAKLTTLTTPVTTDTVNFAKDWLVNHIKGTDFKYKGLL